MYNPFLDPARGSESFLIRACQALLDWHLEHYHEDGVTKHTRGRHRKIYPGPLANVSGLALGASQVPSGLGVRDQWKKSVDEFP